MKRYNICSSNFDICNDDDLFFINNTLSGQKIGFYLENDFNSARLKFPCYYIADLCGDPGTNICFDLEILYVVNNISSKPTYLMVNDINKIKDTRYTIFLELLSKCNIITVKQDILFLVDQLFKKKATYVDSQIEI